MMETQPKKKRGRPAKKRNAKAIVVDKKAVVCPKCGSTDREPYHQTRVIHGPVTVAGKTYERIEIRRTECLGCGQHRVERELYPQKSV